MRKKNYRGVKCTKRSLAKCDGVCRTYDAIQYAYADILNGAEDILSFQCNVLLEGLVEGEYTSDFVITKQEGGLMIRECINRNHLSRPMSANLLDISRSYWKSHGITDWGIVIEKEGAENEES